MRARGYVASGMRWNIKPSKPVAVFSALVGVAIIVVGLVSMEDFNGFTVLWVLVGAAIIVFNLWAAFSPRGSVYSAQLSADDADRRSGRDDAA